MLLLDEPLGALDAKLRKRLQIELKALQEEVGITFIYVTHDQEEALTMSDRIAVMSQGRVEQVGPPKEIYEEPATAYVADFLGVSNLMDCHGRRPDRRWVCRLDRGVLVHRRTGRRGHSRPGEGDDPPGAGRPRGAGNDGRESGTRNGRACRLRGLGAAGDREPRSRAAHPGMGAERGRRDAFESGAPITVHFPSEALRVLPEAGTAVMESGELDDEP